MKYLEQENAYSVIVTENEVLVMGCPDEDDEQHNCDVMGCSSVEHVLLRCRKSQCLIGFAGAQKEKEV
jgi:hypothetical protein